MPRRWCEFRAFADAQRAEIMIMDFIGHWGYGAAEFVSDLRGLGDAKAIDVVISSNGGDPLVAFAVAELMRAHPARVTTRVVGVAASAASIIAMAGDEVVMGRDSFMMIHDAAADVGMAGPLSSDELRSAAEALDRIQGQIVAFYARKTGLKAARIRELMAAATYMTAEEAVDLGFADRIEEAAVKMAARVDLSVLSNVPAALAGLAARGDTAQPAHEEDHMADKPTSAGATPVDPKPLEQPAPAPTPPAPAPTPAPQPNPSAIASARAEGEQAVMTRVTEIMDLCTLVGQPGKAGAFIASGKPVAEIRRELVEARATAGDPIDTRQEGAMRNSGAAQWGDAYKPFRAENARPFGQRM